MKRLFFLSLTAALVGWSGSAQAGCSACQGQCKEVPCPECPDCTPPCQGHHHCSARKSENARRLTADLGACDSCTRIKAAKKLGHRLTVDFCCDCEVLPALVRALLCDPCYSVRQAAAWSIAMQGARTDLGLAALYVSSRLDKHYMVRAKALEALDILILCRKPCYKEIFKAADALVAQLKKDKIVPGKENCCVIISSIGTIHGCAGCRGGEVVLTVPGAEQIAPPVVIQGGTMPKAK